MAQSIFIPVDFTESSYNAVRFVFNMNKEIEASLILFHVYQKTRSHRIKNAVTEAIPSYLESGKLEEAFEEVIYRLQSETGRVVDMQTSYVNSEDGLADDILHEAKRIGADWIAMGTHGANSIKDYILGSNTSHVVEKSELPVLAIPFQAGYDGDIDEIVFGVQFQQFPHEHIKSLIDLAQQFDANITCLGVNVQHNPLINKSVDAIRDRYKEYPIRFEIIDAMTVVDAIIEWSNDHRVDFITMHKERKPGLFRLFQRSYTEDLIFHSKIPVLNI